MNDLISRQAAIDALKANRMLPLGDHPAYNRAMVDSEKVIRNLPSAQPRMKGRWTKGINENGVTTSLFCSECNYENKHWYEWNYCPNCGADMRGKQDESN